MCYAQAMREAQEEFAAYERNKHVVIWYGKTKVIKYFPIRYCTVCGKRAVARFLCHTHYLVWWSKNSEKGKLDKQKRHIRNRIRKKIRYWKLKERKRNGHDTKRNASQDKKVDCKQRK